MRQEKRKVNLILFIVSVFLIFIGGIITAFEWTKFEYIDTRSQQSTFHYQTFEKKVQLSDKVKDVNISTVDLVYPDVEVDSELKDGELLIQIQYDPTNIEGFNVVQGEDGHISIISKRNGSINYESLQDIKKWFSALKNNQVILDMRDVYLKVLVNEKTYAQYFSKDHKKIKEDLDMRDFPTVEVNDTTITVDKNGRVVYTFPDGTQKTVLLEDVRQQKVQKADGQVKT